jgi:hypothetical protein
MNDHSAESIIRQRREREHRQNIEEKRRHKEIAYYLVFATIPKAAAVLQKKDYPTSGPIYGQCNEDLMVQGERRVGWYLANVEWSGARWKVYLLQRDTLVMQCIDQTRKVQIVSRRSLRGHITRTEDLTAILYRLRSLGGILARKHPALEWWQYPGFWFCHY